MTFWKVLNAKMYVSSRQRVMECLIGMWLKLILQNVYDRL